MTALKPIGKTLAEFQPLQPAEQKLLVACRAGEIAEISAQRPTEATPDNTVRAAFLRFMLLGGDERAPVHEKGVQLQGACVVGTLDMSSVNVPSNILLALCRFHEEVILRDARIEGMLNLQGSYMFALSADRVVCDGSFFLRHGFIANGEVRLRGALINGSFSCNGGEFNGINADALCLDSAEIKGNVNLGKGFIAKAHVILAGVKIDGDLNCNGGSFDGFAGRALTLDGSVIKGAFFFRKLMQPVNKVSLTSACISHFVDDKNSWGMELVFDNFIYESFSGGAPTDAATRIAWLDKQSAAHAGLDKKGAEFKPQPWRQLIKVLREMGHAEDARQVSIAFEQRLRAANLIGQTPKDWNRFRAWSYRKISRTGHRLFGVLTGYGYRPLRLLAWMVGVWLFCAVLYWCAAVQGVFAPSDPLVFQNEKYEVCAPSYVAPASAVVSPIKGAGNWYLCAALPEEYSGFSPLAYSLDVIFPLVDLQQESSWSPLIPTPNKTWYKELFTFEGGKHWTRLLVWFEILFGWVASLLLVAVVSGLTKRREE